MAYEVKYDDGTQQWSAFFASEAEALDQAAMDANVYGGQAPQEIVDGTGTQVVDSTAIQQAADALP